MAPTRDALRVQAAAVAAQQAALTEDESRLRQQRQALEQQQTQLIAHLDQKRGRLIELRDEARQAYAELKTERAKYERFIAESMRQLEVSRAEIADAQQQLRNERDDLQRLRQRLKRRWHRQWLAERSAQRRREARVSAQLQELARDKEALQAAKEELYRLRCRFNGEVELGRRQLQDARHQFEQQQLAWEEGRAQPLKELDATRRLLEQQAAEQAKAAAGLEEQQRQAAARRRQLEKETAGLDQRIHNQRSKLLELEEVLRRREVEAQLIHANSISVPATAEIVSSADDAFFELEQRVRQRESDLAERLAALERLTAELEDQRLHVAGECARLEEARRSWQAERAAAAAELEPRAQSLQEREQAIEGRETEQRLRQGQVDRLRKYLCAWQARLDCRAAAWDAERERLLADLQSWEEANAAAPPQDRDLSRLRQRIHSLQAQANIYEQHIRELNDAVERLSWALLDDQGDDTAPPIARAA